MRTGQVLYVPKIGQRANLQHPILRGCVGWWPLNDGAGSTMANILNGLDLNLYANATHGVSEKGRVADLDGSANTCLAFRANDDPTLVAGPFTASIWAYIRNTATEYIAAWAGGNLSDRFWWISKESDESLRLTMARDDTTDVVCDFGGAGVFNLNQWYHIVGTFDGTNMVIYLDGIASSPTALGGAIASSPYNGFGVGGRRFYNTVQGEADGFFSNFRYWNRSLSGSEVIQLYTQPWLGLSMPSATRYFFVPQLITASPKLFNISGSSVSMKSNAGRVSVRAAR